MIDRNAIPTQPGVYLFEDASGEVIYVGKAKSLRSRVSSYFTHKQPSPRIAHLVTKIADVQFFIVDTEIEALLLENRLIKQHKPKYNVMLKDDKTFAYLLLTEDPYPRLCTTRTTSKKGTYFGPYVDGSARRDVMQLAIRIFKLRVCKTLPKRACLNYHLGLCTAPCIGNVSKGEYADQVREAKAFLKGETREIEEKLAQQMRAASASQQYELALERRRQLEAIGHLRERQKIEKVRDYDQDIIACKRAGSITFLELLTVRRGVLAGRREFKFDGNDRVLEQFLARYYETHEIPREIIVSEAAWEDDAGREALEQYLAALRKAAVTITLPRIGEKRKLVELARTNLRVESEALTQLQEKLTLPQPPQLIECFDISNLGSEHIVAGMTQWIDGYPAKDGYRRFLLRTVTDKNDDFAAMREVIQRRYETVSAKGERMPDLIIVDGGAGQLSAAREGLAAAGVHAPIVALAKQREELYLPGEQTPRTYDENSPMMLLLRKVRDTTHKQAITYNRKRRSMRLRDEMR